MTPDPSQHAAVTAVQDQAWRLTPWLENPRASSTVYVVDVCMHGGAGTCGHMGVLLDGLR